MALNVGELYMEMGLRGELEDELRQAERRVESLSDTGDEAARRLRQIAMPRDLRADAERATQSIEDIGDEARTTQQRLDQVRFRDDARREAERTAEEVSNIGRAARNAADDMENLGDSAGGEAGAQTAGGFIEGLADGLSGLASSTGPVAGSILGIVGLGVGVGAAFAAAIQDGMQSELTEDTFRAKTGLNEAQARKFGLASGESFSDAFGASIESNLGTAQIALETGLLDPESTQRDAEAVINSLTGVSDILGEEIPAVARAASQAVKTGFAVDMNDALDLIVAGQQAGLNVSEDWLDTINEYSVQFQALGVEGPEAIGLMSQALKGGARDTDLAADALKEFSIRAIDGSEAAADAYEAIGLNAEEMTAQIARGGDDASDGLRQVLNALRAIDDPVAQSAAAVGLFGTQAEDMKRALLNMNLDTAVDALNDYEGAAQSAIDVMGGNSATAVQGAFNSISAAADGLKQALAEAFGPYIQDWANSISNNRAGVIDFFTAVGNGGFEAAEAVLSFVEGSLRGIGSFVAAGMDMSASFLRQIASMVGGMENFIGLYKPLAMVLGIDLPDFDGVAEKLNHMALNAETAGDNTQDALNGVADSIRDSVIPGLNTAQERFNQFAGGVRDSAAFNDAVTAMIQTTNGFADAMGEAGLSHDTWTGKLNEGIPAQRDMADALRDVEGKLEDQVKAGLEAGASTEELTEQWEANRGALIESAMQLGLTNEQALALVDSYNLTPDLIETVFDQPGMPESQASADILKDKILGIPDEKTIQTTALTDEAIEMLEALGYKVERLPNGTVKVIADTEQAEADMLKFTQKERIAKVKARVESGELNFGEAVSQAFPVVPASPNIRYRENADGNVYNPGQASIKNATVNQWAEAGPEAFIPMSPAKRPRSEAILNQVADAFGFRLTKWADGGITSGELDSYARGIEGADYVFGGWGNGWSTDCSGAVSIITNLADGRDPMGGGRFATGTEDGELADRGFFPGKGGAGDLRVGWLNGGPGGGHTALTLPNGINVEMGGARGNGQYGGGAAGGNDSQFTNFAFKPINHGDNGETVPGADALAAGDYTSEYREATGIEEDEANVGGRYGTSGSGSVQDVRVVNFPGQEDAGERPDDRQPKARLGLAFYNKGGTVGGSGNTDTVPAMLTPDEEVTPQGPARKHRALLKLIAQDKVPGFNAGGTVGGFGGYAGKPKDRKLNAMDYAGLASGLFFTAASGFGSDGSFKGFDTGNTDIPGVIDALERVVKEIQENPPIVVEHAEIKANDPQQLVDGLRSTDIANLALTRRNV